MQSYRLNNAGSLITRGCELCIHAEVLSKKLWGKTPVEGRLRPERWWRNRLNYLIDGGLGEEKTIQISEDFDKDFDWTIPFEIEMNFPNLNYEILLKAWKNIYA